MREKARLRSRFMSACFDLVVIGALLQLWIFSFSSISVLLAISCLLLCCVRQRLNPVFPSVSMPLRPKRFVRFCYSVHRWDFFFFL